MGSIVDIHDGRIRQSGMFSVHDAEIGPKGRDQI